jgi:FixJ family two-component response regulator
MPGFSPTEVGNSPGRGGHHYGMCGDCAGAILATCSTVQAGRSVVVVDDKRELADTLADGLTDRGYDALAIDQSRDALAMIEAGTIGVLVTDLRMPDPDGMALLSAARRHDPSLPVIVMTAYGAIDSAVDAIRHGALYYLTKPFKLDELAVFVERALAERALRRETAELREAVRAFGALPALGDGVLPMREVQRRYARWAFAQLDNLKLHTAEKLGIDIKTLNRWLTCDEEH